MKEMAQDEFYSATSRFDAGEKARTLSRKVDFPEGALPSIGEEDRMIDFITPTTNVMDGDLREALVNDEMAEECVGQRDVDGFDYEAYPFSRISRSSSRTGNNNTSEGILVFCSASCNKLLMSTGGQFTCTIKKPIHNRDRLASAGSALSQIPVSTALMGHGIIWTSSFKWEAFV
ncbi:hypothetical protein CCR75_007240 [Bremia lactucae]|uniref:Uncharacterized protein n=1 Tax=Bremia lactucae TaxID=4779 RepID=A0A976FMQ0_BRELC|nr:hypothetical protein CCR75_007240 [Bremia lactucae]